MPAHSFRLKAALSTLLYSTSLLVSALDVSHEGTYGPRHLDLAEMQNNLNSQPVVPAEIVAAAGARLSLMQRVIKFIDPSQAATGVASTSDSRNTTSGKRVSQVGLIEHDEEEDEGSDAFDANFDKPCSFVSTFHTCGDSASPATGTVHGLFCSPGGICAGKGAACGSSEACSTDLVCDYTVHRCVAPGSSQSSSRLSRQADHRRASTANTSCPTGFEACPTGAGGFECVDTQTDVHECGACHSLGGEKCYERAGVLASSCRQGACVIHACAGGFAMRSDGSGCDEEYDENFV